MRINLLSSFAAGILISTTICGVVYFSDTTTTTQKASAKSSEKVQLTATQMKDKLESEGYVVQTKEELEKTLQAAKGTETKAAEPKEKAVTQVVVNVADGMTSIDVANVLLQAKLIPDAFKFTQDIEARGLQNALRPGSFTVTSDMSYDQIIATIFTN
ncbi:aminodeoxychorismate lyase [Neobacillus sp. CF12]|uniref:aminodeoxychorismate lyase n=1 Tax=Neobacillus sp. CF12 TaxID=3055864 RepID=UPI0025A0DC23|nr:aminodeoxychorismate lyase [Neobacillus sp. CF12]MDM5326381.1 aminodeoxychorismate lyase [Neobacillus sp. CF12]